MDEYSNEGEIDLTKIDAEPSSYLPLTRRGYTRKRLNLSTRLTQRTRMRLKKIDDLSHSEAISILSRKSIISTQSKAPTHLLKNMLVSLLI